MNEFTSAQTADSQNEEDNSIFEILTAIGQDKWTIILFTLFSGIAAAIVSLVLPPVFTAKTLVIPPQQQQTSQAISLASLVASAGVATGALGVKSPDDMYLSFMTSEVFQKKIIGRFKLMDRFHCSFVIDCRLSLNSHARIILDKKSTLLAVEVDDFDPIFAANMANAYIEELVSLLGKLAVTDAQQRRLYFENQIKKTQKDLAVAETYFRSAQQRSGLQLTSINAEIGVKEISELHGQIAAREIQLQALDMYSTPQNTDVKRLFTELTALKMRLLKIEKGSPESSSQPENIQQEAIQAYRNMKVQESLLEVFAKQYELAKVDESKDGPLIQILDPASPPERRSSPKRTQLVLVSAIIGFIFSLLFILFKNALRNSVSTPRGKAKLDNLKAAWL